MLAELPTTPPPRRGAAGGAVHRAGGVMIPGRGLEHRSHIESPSEPSSNTVIEKYIRKKTSYPDTIVNVNPIARLKLSILYFIFFIGIKFKAPKILVDPIPNNIDLEELKKKWLQSRKSFKMLIESLDEKDLNKGVLKHPLVGRINMNMTLDFLFYHFKNHKKIIHKLENKL